MSNEAKLIFAVILLAIGALSFFYGDRDMKVRAGAISKFVFPRQARPYRGKIFGIGLCLIALLLLDLIFRT